MDLLREAVRLVYIIALGGWTMFEGTGDVEKWVKQGLVATTWIYYVKLLGLG